jgi:hypothetical protein
MDNTIDNTMDENLLIFLIIIGLILILGYLYYTNNCEYTKKIKETEDEKYTRILKRIIKLNI